MDDNLPPEPDPPDKNKDKKDDVFYKDTDIYPYEVYIQSKNNNVGKFHLVSIAKEIFNLNLTNIININKKGKNRIGVTLKTYQAANDLVKNIELKNKGYDIFIPSHHISCKGIVKFVDKSITDKELMDYSSTNLTTSKILNVKRFNRRVVIDGETQYLPTGTILFTFSGRHIPAEISIYNLPMRVIPYVGHVIQCEKCFLFGHTGKLCKGKPKCSKCGSIHEVGFKCKTKCMHCKIEGHQSNDKNNCPEFTRQKNIKETMAYANKSYYEASLLVPKPKIEEPAVLDESNYPALGNTEKIITIQQRRGEAIMGNRNYSSYSQMTQGTKKRKHNNNTGYDRQEYNKYLNNPNGRTISTPTNSNRVNREDKEEKMNQDFTDVLQLLTEPQKELILNFISNIITNQLTNQRNNISTNIDNLSREKNNTEWSEDSEY